MKLSEEIRGILAEDPDISIVKFAVEANVHTQTVYNALNDKPLKPRSVNKLNRAVLRFRNGPLKSKAVG